MSDRTNNPVCGHRVAEQCGRTGLAAVISSEAGVDTGARGRRSPICLTKPRKASSFSLPLYRSLFPPCPLHYVTYSCIIMRVARFKGYFVLQQGTSRNFKLLSCLSIRHGMSATSQKLDECGGIVGDFLSPNSPRDPYCAYM